MSVFGRTFVLVFLTTHESNDTSDIVFILSGSMLSTSQWVLSRKSCLRLNTNYRRTDFRITIPMRHFHFLLLNMLLNVYNFKRFLACIIFLTTRSVLFFLPGNRSMAWIILVSAFHLSCKFLARL